MYIQKSIDSLKGSMTVAIIAHRLSTTQNADLIYALDEGRILEQGSYEALVNDSGSRFSKMVAIQSLSEGILITRPWSSGCPPSQSASWYQYGSTYICHSTSSTSYDVLALIVSVLISGDSVYIQSDREDSVKKKTPSLSL